MKRFWLFLVVTALCCTMLASCVAVQSLKDSIFGTEEPAAALPSEVWSPAITAGVVYDEASEDIDALCAHIEKLTGNLPVTGDVNGEPAKNEIVFGDVGREISDVAYEKLDRFADLYSIETDGISAYLVYSMGGSIAVAYTDGFARYEAVRFITENYTESTLALTDGTLKSESFVTSEYLAAKREAERDGYFALLGEELGEDTAEAVRLYYNLFDERLYVSLANLYDPELGGFYYSSSARNAKRYLPDVESTGQALLLIDMLGLSAGADELTVGDAGYRYPNLLPKEMVADLFGFVDGLRAHNGFYYHDQWGTFINSTRRDSDRSWGEHLCKVLGIALDNGFEGSEANPPAEEPATEEEKAEAKVTILAYLEATLKPGSTYNFYTVSENFKANYDAIKLMELSSAVVEDLNSRVLANGIYDPRVDLESIGAVANFMRLFGDSLVFPDPTATICSAIEAMHYKAKAPASIYDIYNCWYVVANLLPTLDEAETALINEIIEGQKTDILISSFDKLSMFKNLDGGFSTYFEKSGQYHKEMLVAAEGVNESDMNATYIATVTVFEYILPILGIDAPVIFFDYDTEFFLQTLDRMDGVIKETTIDKVKPVISDVECFDFESGTLLSGYGKIIVNNSLSDVVSRVDGESLPNATEGCFLSIVTDPTDATNKVLQTLVSDGLNSSLTLYPYIENPDGAILVFEFDYNYVKEGYYYWGGIDHFDINFSDDTVVSEQAIFKPTLYDNDGDGELEVSYRGGNISGDAGAALNVPSGTWIKIRAVIDEVTHKLDIYMSTDGGESWFYCLNKSKTISESSVISMTLRFTATLATGRVEYFDNISFKRMGYITFDSNIGYKRYGIVPVEELQ